jgi:YggT family protein
VEVYLIILIDIVVRLLTILLVIYALMSFAPLEPWHPARRFLDRLVQPILQPFRNVMPPMGMFDLSVMIAIITIQIAGYILKIMVQAAF